MPSGKRAAQHPFILERDAHERLSETELIALYEHNQLLLLRGASSALYSCEQLAEEWREDAEWVGREWTIENGASCSSGPRKAVDVLGTAPEWPQGSWYCSAILEGGFSQRRVLRNIGLPPALGSKRLEHGEAVWVFVGRHDPVGEETPPLSGRGEHTDEVFHSGTWHIQTEGTKVWRVRPNRDAWPADAPAPAHLGPERGQPTKRQGKQKRKVSERGSDQLEPEALMLECRAGDVLLINTRLWFHSTSLPAQAGLSMSVARDFYLDAPPDAPHRRPAASAAGASLGASMTNRVGPVAGRGMGAAELVLSESPVLAVAPVESEAADGVPCHCCARCAKPLSAGSVPDSAGGFLVFCSPKCAHESGGAEAAALLRWSGRGAAPRMRRLCLLSLRSGQWETVRILAFTRYSFTSRLLCTNQPSFHSRRLPALPTLVQ